MGKTIEVKVKRQDNPNSSPYWEGFSVPYEPNMNVISVLQAIQRNPVNKNGKTVAPVVWECNCLEEVCGACTMIINGEVKQSCSALIDQLSLNITLEPMTKFPVIRDLMVDRKKMFDALIKVKAWIPIDGTYNLGPGPRIDQKTQEVAYSLQKCMTCGCCVEACPQYNKNSPFIGAAAINQVRLFNLHPLGKMQSGVRLDAMMEKGGVHDCGNAQNCVQVCPKEIPLTDSIAAVGGSVTIHAIKKLLFG